VMVILLIIRPSEGITMVAQVLKLAIIESILKQVSVSIIYVPVS
jgi:hypothetical protein